MPQPAVRLIHPSSPTPITRRSVCHVAGSARCNRRASGSSRVSDFGTNRAHARWPAAWSQIACVRIPQRALWHHWSIAQLMSLPPLRQSTFRMANVTRASRMVPSGGWRAALRPAAPRPAASAASLRAATSAAGFTSKIVHVAVTIPSTRPPVRRVASLAASLPFAAAGYFCGRWQGGPPNRGRDEAAAGAASAALDAAPKREVFACPRALVFRVAVAGAGSHECTIAWRRSRRDGRCLGWRWGWQ
eukprot:5629891-Prymnesium_polylepis.1